MSDFDAMVTDLAERFREGCAAPWSDSEFERRALAAFAWQFQACDSYRALCLRRDATPDTVATWEDVPAVPATAFKYFDLVSADGAPQAVFRTSGTTRGDEARGRHLVPRVELYRASCVGPFRAALLSDGEPDGEPGRKPDGGRDGESHREPVREPDGAPGGESGGEPARASDRESHRELGGTPDGASDGDSGGAPDREHDRDRASAAARGSRMPLVSLVPPPTEAPESSLSFMVGVVAERFASDTEWLVDAEGRWTEDVERVFAARREAGEPTLVVGTALALVHLMERAEAGALRLPDRSRVMETGGFKGARTSLTRQELHGRITRTMDLAPDHVVNEYGMTELLSQLYEPVLTEGPAASGWHVPPPWLRVRALDPATLRPLEEGEEGILAFFDLANLGSICHVLTEDVGAVREGRVRLRGRAPGAEPRGCSRAMDDLMSAAGRR